MMLCDQHRRLSVDRDRESTQQRNVDLGCRGDLFHRRIFPRSDRKPERFLRVCTIVPAACLETFGVTETLQR